MQFGKERSYQEILDEAQEASWAFRCRASTSADDSAESRNSQVKVITDPLTGLANRARFDEFFEEQFRRAYAHLRPLAVVFIDIDHFKQINDIHGHQAGDEVLRQVGRLLRGSCATSTWSPGTAARNSPSCSPKPTRAARPSAPRPCAPSWQPKS